MLLTGAGIDLYTWSWSSIWSWRP